MVKKNAELSLGVDLPGLLRHIAGAVAPEDVLRELVQNASDAIMLRLTKDPSFPESEAEIRIELDPSNATLAIRDNGSGMTLEEFEVLIDSLGTSGKRIAAAFDSAERAGGVIGQYGIGFLSVFSIAEVIEVSSTPSNEQSSTLKAGLQLNGHITLAAEQRNASPGTAITLHLNSAGKALDEVRVLELLRRDLRFVRFPVSLGGRRVHIGRSVPEPQKGSDFSARVARVLQDRGYHFDSEVSIAGLRPDFVVHGPNDRLIIVETKAWSPQPGSFARAVAQAERYKEATGADAALVVLANTREGKPSEGVVALDGLIKALDAELEKAEKPCKRKEGPTDSPTVFAAMPFAAEYDDTYFVAMAPAAAEIGAACVRVDQESFSGDVVSQIQTLIRRSLAVIVDLSESKPNVLYEAGFAHALDIPVVHVCSSPVDELPFDVRNWRTIEYARGRTSQLLKPLAEELRAIT